MLIVQYMHVPDSKGKLVIYINSYTSTNRFCMETIDLLIIWHYIKLSDTVLVVWRYPSALSFT